LGAQKDQRVVDGGVSDCTTTAVMVDDEAAAREMRDMLDALARRMGQDGAATKH
jgi:hypothetical protein